MSQLISKHFGLSSQIAWTTSPGPFAGGMVFRLGEAHGERVPPWHLDLAHHLDRVHLADGSKNDDNYGTASQKYVFGLPMDEKMDLNIVDVLFSKKKYRPCK